LLTIMKKRMITGLLQYIGAAVLILASVLTVFAFDAGVLPFMDEDYLDARSQALAGTPLPDMNEEDIQSEKPQQAVTAATFISSLPKAGTDVIPYVGVYGGGNANLANRPVSSLGVLGDSKLELRCGFIIKTENGKVLSVYDSQLRDITTVIDGWTLTYLRSAEGKPLFTKDGQHAYVENGALVPCDYDAVNLDKGVYSEYTAYPMGYDKNYIVFKNGGFYGMKKTDGTIVVPAEFMDVYGMSEGYCIAVDGEKRLHLFDQNGTLISDEYFVSQKDDASAVGYYFVKNGVTRACTSKGEEILLRTDGNVISVPTGFTVCAYSDGVALLKGNSGYGYMNSKGRWISTPDYKHALPFSEGLAVFCDADGNYGMLSLDGNCVVPAVFSNIVGCFDGVILAYAEEYGYYIINKLAA